MTIQRTKPGGWGYAEVLTSAQITAIDANIENAVDKRTGQTDTIESDLTINGDTDFNGTVQLDGYVTVTDAIFMNGARFAGPIKFPVKQVVGPTTYTVDTVGHDFTLFVDSSSGVVSINLPAASVSAGRVLIIKSVANSGTNNITIVRNGSDNIEAIGANYVMDADYQSVTLQCYNGASGWFIIATA